MKRAIVISIILLILVSAGIYLIIPSQINITQITVNEASELNTSRFLLHKKNWIKWWPGQKSATDSSLFLYKGKDYDFEKSTNSGVELLITEGDTKIQSKIVFLTEDNLKVKLIWTAEMPASNNLFKKLAYYQSAKKIDRDIASILQYLKTFLENGKNVYGLSIRLSKVKDPLMLATSAILDRYPDMQVVDAMVKKLRDQIKAQNALETNHPMLNINQVSKTQFQVMVAIPINKEFKPGANTIINKMVMGNILEADVIGGPNTIKAAFNEIRIFSKDYRFTSPAMPFESMVTNRVMEKDTSKWITKIYYPIF